MLDINLFRQNPDIVRQNLKRRKDEERLKQVDEIIKLDNGWRRKKVEVDNLRSKRNELTKKIQELKKQKKDAQDIINEAREVGEQLKDAEELMLFYKQKLDALLKSMPNIMHESVPYGKDDTENVEVKKWGAPRKFEFELKSHVELGENLGLLEFDKSAKISGSGFYFMKGDLALLNQALIRFAIDHMMRKGYLYVEPPLMIRRKPYEGVTDLNDFENVMYKIENDDLYMIATSEHPLVSQYMDEVLSPDELPIKLCGYSMCFRREVGSHGIDTKGLYRTHQFNKVEQVVICKPEDSWELHKEIVQNTEDFFQALELPYRIVNICTGDLGIVAAKKYDIEVWMPRQGKYAEAGSASNCTDYQARRLNIKYGQEGGEKFLVHTLNNTVVATSRALVAIMENYQNEDGTITVPKVLVPYMNGKTLIK
ncbi:serine--tRNA ligase [Candidatus Woesearchaeota archaeon]|nr:MAG: serine--tRNA ligase [Candidatus Woesearchaeota archaeon]